jgi:hypothetical protein
LYLDPPDAHRDHRKEQAMQHLTYWVNVNTGDRLDLDALRAVEERAHRLYEANTHIFGDEREALEALGVAPLVHMEQTRYVA